MTFYTNRKYYFLSKNSHKHLLFSFLFAVLAVALIYFGSDQPSPIRMVTVGLIMFVVAITSRMVRMIKEFTVENEKILLKTHMKRRGYHSRGNSYKKVYVTICNVREIAYASTANEKSHRTGSIRISGDIFPKDKQGVSVENVLVP